MKKHGSIVLILSLVCVCVISVGCAANQPGAATAPPNSGHLLVNRAANFGINVGLILSVDGKDVGSLPEGQNYDGYLSAGQHRLTARADPPPTGASPGRTTLTVKAGQTYSYTAAWSGPNLVLVRNQ